MTTAPKSAVDTSSLETLLLGPPPPNCVAEPIDFSKTPIIEYSKAFALLIHNLLSPDECGALLEAVKSTTGDHWEQAMINVGNGRQELALDTRNCGRIIWDTELLASRLLDRILPYLPPDIVTLSGKAEATWNGLVKRKETWRLSRLNERLRFLKYTKGMYFRAHYDGNYVTPDGKEVSFLTVHLYLNGNDGTAKQDVAESVPSLERKKSINDLPLKGGATRFLSMSPNRYVDVVPTSGTCLIFQHRGLLHTGEEVDQGTKFTVRTDVMYKREVNSQD